MRRSNYFIAFAIALILLSNISEARDKIYNLKNEIIKGQGVCDPHICIFNDTAYLFASHDYGPNQSNYKMVDWLLYSSTDLVNWTKEFVLKPEDTFIGPWIGCYAPDGATRNGKYYFYFSQQQIQTGVAVSDKPEGPYVDALGKPLLSKDLTPTADYDPCVFIDDDAEKTPYIAWGFTVIGQDYYIAKLNEDMISLAEEPRKIVIENSWGNDAIDIHKKNGIYYLNSHEAHYATSDNIYGPYTYRGKYTTLYCDHGNFFEWKNQSYHSYGVRVNWNDNYYRTTKITYAHYKDNGEIVTDDFISNANYGVGQYDARWKQIEAEWYFAASDNLVKKQNQFGFEIQKITNNSYLHFPKVRNLSTTPTLYFNVSSENTNDAVIEVRDGAINGELLGNCVVPNTRSFTSYKTIPCKLKNAPASGDLFFVFKGKGEELFRLDWFNTDVNLTY